MILLVRQPIGLITSLLGLILGGYTCIYRYTTSLRPVINAVILVVIVVLVAVAKRDFGLMTLVTLVVKAMGLQQGLHSRISILLLLLLFYSSHRFPPRSSVCRSQIVAPVGRAVVAAHVTMPLSL